MSLQSNIWEDAIKQKNAQGKQISKQKTFIFLGNQKSGKTSLIKLLKGQSSNQQTKPTILFQYSFIKNISNKKQLINCYQLSNKSQKQLFPSLITKDSFVNTVVILCVDLSKPGNVIDDIKQWISIIRTQFGIACQQKVNLQQKSRQYLKKNQDNILDHEDCKIINPLPIHTIIVGTKYDEYQKEDSQNRKWLSRALRYLAISNYCSLFYSSIKNSPANTQIQSILTQSIFNARLPTLDQKDHMKPIFLTAGSDTISSLGLPTSGSLNILDIIKKQINSLFSTQQQKKKQGIDHTKYHQNRIDKIIQDHKKEMQKINKVNSRFDVQHTKFKV